MEMDALTREVIAAAYKVHNTLGFGFLEKVYENAMMVELRKRGISAEQQYPVKVYYEEERVGNFRADLFVENILIVELQSVFEIQLDHEIRLVNYLTATKKDIGLLINFGLSVQIKRKYRNYPPGKK
ncbi:MAG: GxxExxY protein [Lewinellaceae bacterium]|nr:GxxExxY protein [Lewinellaceae bacterium]